METRKNERLKEKQQLVPRYCKYEKCGKLLDYKLKITKVYCPNTDCAYKQNQIDAKRKRDARPPKKQQYKVCEYDPCGKDFPINSRQTRQAYCSEECRANNKAKRQREREQGKGVQERVKTRGPGKEKPNKPIDPRYLVRGNISGASRECTISVNA